MRKSLIRNKWFILICVVVVFIMATSTRVALADTDIQLGKILDAGLDGLIAYFAFLIDVLNKIW